MGDNTDSRYFTDENQLNPYDVMQEVTELLCQGKPVEDKPAEDKPKRSIQFQDPYAVRFDSLEKYIKDYIVRNWEKFPQYDDDDPDTIANMSNEELKREICHDMIIPVENTFRRLCKSFKIDLKNFQNSDNARYCITNAVYELFERLWCLSSAINGEKGHDSTVIRKNDFSSITMAQKVEIRNLYLQALYSVGKDSNTVECEIRKFEKDADCLPYQGPYSPESEITIQTINNLKESYMDYLTDEEWCLFSQLLEYDYLYIWRPKFITYAEKLLRHFLGERGKPIPNFDESNIGFLAKGSINGST